MQKNSGCGSPFLREGPLKIFFRTAISRKQAEQFSPNFQQLRASTVSIYDLDRRSVGVQISAVAGGKVAKNGNSDCGRVAFGGSLNLCTVGISNIFAGYVSRDMWQPETYICETFWGRIKKWGTFKKVEKMSIFRGRPRG